MPDFGRNPEPSLEEIRRSDSFLDALADGLPVAPADQADAALAAMLGNWRDENRWPPDTGLISEPQALAALDAGLAENRTGPKKRAPGPATTAAPRSRRGLSVVGAAAAAMLAIGGFGAVVAGAGPGDALYGLRTMLFGAPKQVRDDQVALAARTEMQQVQEMISRGDWQQAEAKLVSVSSQVASIGDEQQKQQLLDQFNDLSAKVVERNPEATPPPGITYTVPPSATELVPAVAPVTSSSSSASTSSAPTSSASTSSTGSATSSTPSTTPTSVPSAPSSSSPSSSAAATSLPSSSSAATSATQQSAVTTTATTPTSAKPSTTATTASSASPVSSAATTTTSAPAAAATSSSSAGTTGTSAAASPGTTATTTSAPAAAGGAKSATGGAAPAQAGTTTAQAPSSQLVTPTTTTVLIPVPAPSG